MSEKIATFPNVIIGWLPHLSYITGFILILFCFYFISKLGFSPPQKKPQSIKHHENGISKLKYAL